MKLYYSLLDWEWIRCPEMVCLWINLLLRASNSTRREKGMTIRRGQVVASRSQLAKQCGISEQSVRTCITRLISAKQITVSSTKQATIITICKFDKYQQSPPTNQPSNQPSNQPTFNQRSTNDQPTRRNTPISSFLNEKSKHIESEDIIAHTREAKTPKTTQEPSEEFKHFLAWIDKNAPTVATLRDAFTEEQFNKLKESYTADQVRDILLQMHNRPDLSKKYRSAYLTALNWLKRNNSNNGKTSINRKQDVPFGGADGYGESTI